MEAFKNCRICGRFLQTIQGRDVCPDCIEQDETEYGRIRDYLIEHPRSSIYEVATFLDVSISKIKHFLREGRIEIVEKENRFLDCEICGQPIRSGRYCEECARHAVHDYRTTFVGNLPGKQDGKNSGTGTKTDFGIHFYTRNVSKR